MNENVAFWPKALYTAYGWQFEVEECPMRMVLGIAVVLGVTSVFSGWSAGQKASSAPSPVPSWRKDLSTANGMMYGSEEARMDHKEGWFGWPDGVKPQEWPVKQGTWKLDVVPTYFSVWSSVADARMMVNDIVFSKHTGCSMQNVDARIVEKTAELLKQPGDRLLLINILACASLNLPRIKEESSDVLRISKEVKIRLSSLLVERRPVDEAFSKGDMKLAEAIMAYQFAPGATGGYESNLVDYAFAIANKSGSEYFKIFCAHSDDLLKVFDMSSRMFTKRLCLE